MTNWIQAEDFTFVAPTTFTDLRFWNIQESASYLG